MEVLLRLTPQVLRNNYCYERNCIWSITISLGGKDQGAFSAGQLHTLGSMSISQAQAGSGSLTMHDISASGSMSISLGSGTGSGDITVSAIKTNNAFSLTGDQYSDVTLSNLTASASLTVNIAGSGSFTASSLDTGGALSLTKALGSGETAVVSAISGGSVSITLGAGSGHVSAQTIDAGAFTFNAAASTESGNAHNLGVVSASGTTTISLGSTTDLLASAITIASAGGTITKGTGSSDLTINVEDLSGGSSYP